MHSVPTHGAHHRGDLFSIALISFLITRSQNRPPLGFPSNGVDQETGLRAHFHAIAQRATTGHGCLLCLTESQMNKLVQATKGPKRKTLTTTPVVVPARSAAAIPNFDELPDSALVRQSHLVRDPKHPTRPTPLPFSPATFWRRVKDGAFPKPVKLGRITCWRVGDVRAWLADQAAA